MVRYALIVVLFPGPWCRISSSFTLMISAIQANQSQLISVFLLDLIPAEESTLADRFSMRRVRPFLCRVKILLCARCMNKPNLTFLLGFFIFCTLSAPCVPDISQFREPKRCQIFQTQLFKKKEWTYPVLNV